MLQGSRALASFCIALLENKFILKFEHATALDMSRNEFDVLSYVNLPIYDK